MPVHRSVRSAHIKTQIIPARCHRQIHDVRTRTISLKLQVQITILIRKHTHRDRLTTVTNQIRARILIHQRQTRPPLCANAILDNQHVARRTVNLSYGHQTTANTTVTRELRIS